MPVGRRFSPSSLQPRAQDSGRATKKKGFYERPLCGLGWRWEMGGQRPGAGTTWAADCIEHLLCAKPQSGMSRVRVA